MFAVYVEKPNADKPLEALRIGERPEPAVPDGWVRVKMTAASLNWHDKFTLMGLGGKNGRPEVFPMILGCDGVGRLDDGTRVVIYSVVNHPDWIGDETKDPARHTLSEALQGTLAEYVVVPRRNAIALPDGISDHEAAVLGASWMTAYHMMFSQSDICAGQTMLVQGASGGVATALIQLGKGAGIRVWATGRTPEKRAIAAQMGAERTFASNERLPERVDAVFDPVGAMTLAHSVQSVKIGGTVVLAGFTSGFSAMFDIAPVVIDQITVRGSYAARRDDLCQLLRLITTAGIKPHVGHVMPMREAARAFALFESGSSVGKIVLTAD